jgi:20S proteasome subunit beta 2
MSGFNFENVRRNAMLSAQGFPQPKAMKTGTTIVGLIYKDGVVLGADTRATNDTIVADKNCQKIHYIAENIYCCGAGTAADTENTTELIASQLVLHKMQTGRQARVVTACQMLKQMLFKYRGNIEAALVLGGVDVEGPHLYTIYPHGSTDKLPYVTMGSGSLAAMSIFESEYKIDMNMEDAMALVAKAVSAGILNDLGSGSNVDVCVITKDKTIGPIRSFAQPVKREMPRIDYTFPRNTTVFLSEKIVPLAKRKNIIVEGDLVDAMDVST